MSQLDLGTQQLELERYPQQEESTQLCRRGKQRTNICCNSLKT